MNHTSLRRRLLAGAASLMIGAAGAVALSGPAAATDDKPITATHTVGDCEVTIDVTVDTDHGKAERQNSYELSVRVDGEEGTDDEVTGQDIAGGVWEDRKSVV